MKKFISILLSALLVLTMFGVSAVAEGERVSIAVVYSDTVDDKGWCQTMDTGIKYAIEQGYAIDYTPVESVAVSDAQSVLEQLVEAYDIIVVHGAQFGTACTEVAEEYPDQVFAFGTSDKIVGDNVFTYMPMSEEPGYINGIIAGLTTKVNKVGIVGSADGGDSARYVRGFILGLRSVNPECEYMLSWTGSFSDTVGAGDIGKTFVEGGCDVMVGPAQQAVGALRVVDSAENVVWVAQTASQLADFPKVVMAAADYNYAAVIIELVERTQAGMTGGDCIPLNYANKGFTYTFSENEELLPQTTREAAQAAYEALSAQANTINITEVNP